MDGQVDLFDLIDDKPPVPAFTVYTCVWSMPRRCGWCGGGNITGGGAGKLPDEYDEPDTSMFYDYCGKCAAMYGHPTHGIGHPPLNIIRTVTPRPGDAPNLKTTTKKGDP